jgi:hypothetical protein
VVAEEIREDRDQDPDEDEDEEDHQDRDDRLTEAKFCDGKH